MMSTIWKFPIETTDEQFIEMPLGARILSVQTQHDEPVIWAMVDPKNAPVPVRVVIIGTGGPADRAVGLYFVGTYQLYHGAFVRHVFAGATIDVEEKA